MPAGAPALPERAPRSPSGRAERADLNVDMDAYDPTSLELRDHDAAPVPKDHNASSKDFSACVARARSALRERRQPCRH